MSEFDDGYGLDEGRVDEVTAAALSEAMKRRRPEPLKTGFCVWCEEPASMNSAFCSSDCRADYEHDQRIRTIKGMR